MPAYLIVDCEVTDPERYEAYKLLAPPAIAKFGGRYLVRGGEMTPLEGDWRQTITPGQRSVTLRSH